MSMYDQVAPVYDARYDTPEAKAEDATVFGAIAPYITSSITDVGAGTGLLLDMLPVAPENYYGIEPSIGMLTELHRKHPQHPCLLAPYELAPDYDTSLTVSLNGSPSYINPEHYPRLTRTPYLLMFYRPDYRPDFDQPDDLQADHTLIHKIFTGHHTYKQFTVVTNTPIRLQ